MRAQGNPDPIWWPGSQLVAASPQLITDTASGGPTQTSWARYLMTFEVLITPSADRIGPWVRDKDTQKR